jgi:hypothetical protein
MPGNIIAVELSISGTAFNGRKPISGKIPVCPDSVKCQNERGYPVSGSFKRNFTRLSKFDCIRNSLDNSPNTSSEYLTII